MAKIFQHFSPIMKPAFLLTTPKLCLKRTFVSGQSSLPHEWFLIPENLWTFIRFCSGSMIAVFQDTRPCNCFKCVPVCCSDCISISPGIDLTV